MVIKGGDGQGRSWGAKITVSRYVKADFCVAVGRGDGQGCGQGVRKSPLVSNNIKAEFCVDTVWGLHSHN